jgi:xanthine dehydrogenase large subunit
MTYVAQPLPHESARAHVTGAALYTDDLAGRYPNLLHAVPVLSPHAHARVLSIDATLAASLPGVAAILTAADVPGEGDSGANRRDEPLFPDTVLFHRQPVIWVLGESLAAAREGAAAVSVEYQPLPALVHLQDAIAAKSYLCGPLTLRRGDASAAIAAAPHTLEGEVSIGGQEHFYLETQASIAWLDESGGVAIQSSTQHPSETQEIVARVLGIAAHRVTVECLRMGGAFGGKEVQSFAYSAIAALGAWKTGRPVLVRLPRVLDMALTGKRHPFLARFTAGYDDDGRLHGLQVQLYGDGGWSLDLSEPILGRALFHIDNAYLLPAVHATGVMCRTNKTSQTAFRGFGGPQGMLVVEDVLDRIARSLGLPPEVVRRRNFYHQGDTTHYGMEVKDAGRIERIWDELLTTSSFAARRAEIDAYNAAHPHRKRGIAMTPVKFGISFTATWYNQAGALVLLYRDGTVQVNHGGTEMGQGLHTKIRQIAADGLGVDLELVRLMPTRTDKVPNTSATAASASTDLNGAAVLDACRQLKARLAPVAAELLECPEDALTFSAGRISCGPIGLPFAHVVEVAYRKRTPLFAQGFYRTPEIHWDAAAGQGRPFHYFAYGAAVTEVAVDGFTGAYTVLRTDILQDVGDSVSPLIDRGQVEGGYLQGLGWLTLEELVWNKEGRLMTSGASTYKLPSWSELPVDFRVAFLTRAAESGVVCGSKAVGEPPLMLALSAREAIRDAIAAFGSGGPVLLDSPATPERVFWAVRQARLASQPVAVPPANIGAAT